MIRGIYRLCLAVSLIGLVSGGGLSGKRLRSDQSPNLEDPRPKIPKIDIGAPGSGGNSMQGLKRYKVLPYGEIERGMGKRSVRAVDTQTGELVMIRCQWGPSREEEMQQSAIIQELNKIGYQAVPRWLGGFVDDKRACTVMEYPNGVLTFDFGEYNLEEGHQRSTLKAILVALEQLPYIEDPSNQLVPRMTLITGEGAQFLEFEVVKIEKPDDYSFGLRALQRTAAEMVQSSPEDKSYEKLLDSLDRSENFKPFADLKLSHSECMAQASNNDLLELLEMLPLAVYDLIDSSQTSSSSHDSCQAYRPNGSETVVDVDVYPAESLGRNLRALGKIVQLDDTEFVQTPLDVVPWCRKVEVIYAESVPSIAYLNLLRDQPAQLTQYLLEAIYTAVSALSFLHQSGLYLNAAHTENELDSALVHEIKDECFKLRLRPDRLQSSLEGRKAAAAVERDLLTLYHYVARLRWLCTDPDVGKVLDDLLSRIATLHGDSDFDGATKVAAYFVKIFQDQ